MHFLGTLDLVNKLFFFILTTFLFYRLFTNKLMKTNYLCGRCGHQKENNVEYPGVIKKKSCGIFRESWFLALKILRGITQFCGVSRGEALFCLQFPGLN